MRVAALDGLLYLLACFTYSGADGGGEARHTILYARTQLLVDDTRYFLPRVWEARRLGATRGGENIHTHVPSRFSLDP